MKSNVKGELTVAGGIGIFFLLIICAWLLSWLFAAGKTVGPANAKFNYEWFYDMNASYEAKLGDIQGHRELLEATSDPEEAKLLRVEMVGMKQVCRGLVTKYNANASKINRGLFKSNNLPDTLVVKSCD